MFLRNSQEINEMQIRAVAFFPDLKARQPLAALAVEIFLYDRGFTHENKDNGKAVYKSSIILMRKFTEFSRSKGIS